MDKEQKILNENDFEALKLYEPDSPVNKLVSDKIRVVFEKMFQNTDVNIDDFYFTVTAEETPNAFFIPAYRTNFNKNIIAVTVGLVNLVENVEQFAAIVGHESGHYIWDQLLGGENTIFQERAADLRSVDLLINAGYNPVNVLSVQKLIQRAYKTEPNDLTFDVHGVHSARIDDIEAYLTLKSQEEGTFDKVKPGVSPEWKDFTETVDSAKKDNPYYSYLEKVLLKNFGTTHSADIDNSALLKVLIEELDAYNLYLPVREKSLFNFIYGMEFKGEINPELVTNFAVKLIKKSTIYGDERDSIRRFLNKAKINSVGVFKDLINARKNFVQAVNNFDKDAQRDNARKIKEYEDLNEFVHCFNDYNKDDEIIKPQGEKNIGHEFPWNDVWSEIDKDVEYVYLKYFIERIDRTGLFENYYLEGDISGYIVKEFGEQAHIKNKQYLDNYIKEIYSERENRCKEQIEKLSILARYGRGDISLDTLCKDLDINKNANAICNNIVNICQSVNGVTNLRLKLESYDYAYLSVLDKKILSEDLEEWEKVNNYNFDTKYDKIFMQSDAYEYFIKDDNQVKNIKDNKTHIKPDINRYDTFYSRIVSILFKLINDYENGDDKDVYIVLKTIEKNFIDGTFSNNSIISDRPYSEREWRIGESFRIRRRVAEIQSGNKLFLERGMYDDDSLCREIDFDLGTPRKSLLLVNICETLGYKSPTNQNELLQLLDLEIIRKRFFLEICAEYLRHGYMFDPVEVFIEKDFFIPDRSISDKCVGIISSAFERNMVIESLELKDKMALYQFFADRKLFSEKLANKNKWIKIITDEIIKTNSIEYAEWILMRANYKGGSVYNRSSNDIEFAVQREQLIDFYANYYAKKLGHDDKSQEFKSQAQKIADEISGGLNGNKDDKKFSYQIAKDLLNKISEKILAQEEVAQIFDDAATRKISGKVAEKYDYYGRAVENALASLTRSPDSSKACIEFLNEKLTDNSINRFMDKINTILKGNYNEDYINKQSLTILHENFWAAGLEIRAYLMQKLLNGYSGGNSQKSVDLAIDLFFDKDSQYYDDAKLVINSVYNNLEDYEKELILAAITAASQRDDDNNMTGGQVIGRGLKMFLATKGAAFIKFGQLLSYMPMLDSDIRKELSTMRDQAKIPSRMELINLIKQSMPVAEQEKISYVGKVLGAGSFFVTVQVKYDGKDAVIALKRPHTDKLTSTGMDLINRVIDDLAKADGKYRALKNIARQAQMSAESEINIEKDHEKYKNAVNIYESISVEMDGATWQPDVAKWLAYGATENGENAYKIMEMAPGESLISADMTEQEKHDNALAYVTLELCILLSGNQWDTDRHQGQQNFYNSSFENFMIGIFDTGAQMDEKPKVFDKVMLGTLLYSLVASVKSGKSVSDALMQNVKKLDDFSEKLKKDTIYIDGVQRGLTALSDIIEYQKEIKDDDGNVIQESKSLTVDDFANIIGAIHKSGLIDNTVKRSVMAAAVLDNLIPSKKTIALLKSLKAEPQGNIVVNYKPKQEQILLERQNVSKQEQEDFIKSKQKLEHLGIKRGLTEKTDFVQNQTKVSAEF